MLSRKSVNLLSKYSRTRAIEFHGPFCRKRGQAKFLQIRTHVYEYRLLPHTFLCPVLVFFCKTTSNNKNNYFSQRSYPAEYTRLGTSRSVGFPFHPSNLFYFSEWSLDDRIHRENNISMVLHIVFSCTYE